MDYVSDLRYLRRGNRSTVCHAIQRIHAPGLLYHLMARGNNGQKVFVSDKDYEAFLDQLRVVRGRYPFYLYAYVLMPNHFHLLLEVRESPTARIMQSLLTVIFSAF